MIEIQQLKFDTIRSLFDKLKMSEIILINGNLNHISLKYYQKGLKTH
ncbi:hypothetical protein FHS70_002069 [Flammeovirga yaeyamensis]|nr:hypothetical protein [Flammeovirga yaeyamensis]